MPPVVCAMLFVGILSAAMSSSDSDLLSAGTVFANDIYKVFLKKDADDDRVMFVAKASICAIGGTAMLIAGTMVVYLAYVFDGHLLGFYFSQPAIPGLAAAFICFVLFSLFMPSRAGGS